MQAIEGIAPETGKVGAVLVDSGYPEVLAATGREKYRKSVAELAWRDDPPPEDGPGARAKMAWKLATARVKAVYKLRKQTVGYFFGIVKEAMGFRRFHLRGLERRDRNGSL